MAKKQQVKKGQLRSQLLDLLARMPSRSFHLRAIERELGVRPQWRKQLRLTLDELVADQKVKRLRNKHYRLKTAPTHALEGIVQLGRGRRPFVTLLDPAAEIPEGKIYLTQRTLHTAMDGDRVAVALHRRQRGQPSGEVTQILERKHNFIVGKYRPGFGGGIIEPRNWRLKRQLWVARKPDGKTLREGDWVLVQITDFTSPPDPLLGEIKEVIGRESDPGIDILLLLKDRGARLSFPENVLKETEQLPDGIPEEEVAQRTDLRERTILTIDPHEAKDFDDALSIEKPRKNLYRLGVHIADVSYYVREDSALDQEAFERGNSIYPLDRVVPMLPERISNKLASLRPDEDRLAFSVIMDINTKGEVVKSNIFPSIIRSCCRLTYEEVEAIYDGTDRWTRSKCSHVVPQLKLLKELTECLIQMRQNRGKLELDMPEVEVKFGTRGEVIDVKRTQSLFSHRVVEEAMVLANEVVADHLTTHELPCIYRIHEPPQREKLEGLKLLLRNFGIELHGNPPNRTQLQEVIEKAEAHPAGHIAQRLVLCSLMKAIYSPENHGHYGLASECYCHFTSPIRRYPDLIVHRILKAALKGRPAHQKIKQWKNVVARAAAQSTATEDAAEEIEREAQDIKALEFMRRFIGEEFEGVISAVLPFGFFVELDEYPVDGLVRVEELGDDYYDFVEGFALLRGKRSGKKFHLGQRVMVQIEKVDLGKLQLDFSLVRTLG